MNWYAGEVVLHLWVRGLSFSIAEHRFYQETKKKLFLF